MSVDRNVKIDHTEEIEEYFLSAGKPMRLDDVLAHYHISHKNELTESLKRILDFYEILRASIFIQIF